LKTASDAPGRLGRESQNPHPPRKARKGGATEFRLIRQIQNPHPPLKGKDGAPSNFCFVMLRMERIVGKASGDSLQKSFGQDGQLLATAEADLARENIVVEAGNFFEQAAIDRDQNPQRGLAVFGDQWE